MPGMGMNYNRTGVMARPQTFRILVFQSPVSHQRWHGVTSWHIYVVVKTLSNWGQALLQTSYKPELLSKEPRGFDRETCPLVGQTKIAPSSSLVFPSTRNKEQMEIHAEL